MTRAKVKRILVDGGLLWSLSLDANHAIHSPSRRTRIHRCIVTFKSSLLWNQSSLSSLFCVAKALPEHERTRTLEDGQAQINFILGGERRTSEHDLKDSHASVTTHNYSFRTYGKTTRQTTNSALTKVASTDHGTQPTAELLIHLGSDQVERKNTVSMLLMKLSISENAHF